MSSTDTAIPATGIHEETLDPPEWNQFRVLCHRMLDDLIDYLASLRTRSAWQADASRGPGVVRRALAARA